MDKIKEGDLYKIVRVFDLTFEIKYGYYDEQDRYSKYNDPIPIYPNFIESPIYTKEGFLIVTQMQNQCKNHTGNKDMESCYGCIFFQEVEELFGICNHHNNKKKT